MKFLSRISLLLVFTVSIISMPFFSNAESKSVKPVMVPLRFICENQGAKLTWDAKTKAVTVKKGSSTISFIVGSKKVKQNGKTINMSDELKSVNGRIKVPLLLINDGLDTNLTVDDCMKILAVKYVDLLQANAVSDCINLFDSNLSQAATPELLKQVGASLNSFGKLTKIDAVMDKNDVHQNVDIKYIAGTLGQIDFIVRFDSDACIDDFKLSTADTNTYKAPAYDKMDNYTEKEVVIGDGEWRLPATLTVPKGNGPFPAVVLVHGSGPNDKDETVGPLKPFRDIASGLASNGVAVLRYEKRTSEHNVKFALLSKATVKEETIDDAIYAVDFLSKYQGVDPSKIFVIGHSQGGMLMPRIINADTDGRIKGAVIMSGPTRPLWDLMEEQYQYLASLNMATKEQAETMKIQADMLRNPGFSPENPPEGFALGMPYWWADLINYYPAEVAKKQVKPLLILQGERDYQVSAQKDFQGWKDALGDKDNVTFKLYPKLNHMYTEGEGTLSTPLEYNKQANIPQYVIDDIVQWVQTNSK